MHTRLGFKTMLGNRRKWEFWRKSRLPVHIFMRFWSHIVVR
jgi:hypothetical protein